MVNLHYMSMPRSMHNIYILELILFVRVAPIAKYADTDYICCVVINNDTLFFVIKNIEFTDCSNTELSNKFYDEDSHIFVMLQVIHTYKYTKTM